MKKIFVSLFLLIATVSFAIAKGSIQNEDVKSVSDIKSSVLTTTGNLSTITACISSIGSTTGLVSGLFIYDSTTPSNISAATTVVAVPGTCPAGQVQMSANAAGNGTGDTLTFGGQPSQAINDTKIWVTANSLNKLLSAAISDGDFGNGGQFYGAIKWATTALCDWNRNSNTYANFSADSDCPAPTVFGNASAPATKVPGITFVSLPAGEYLIVANGFFYKGASGDDYGIYRFSDGTVNSFGESILYGFTSTAVPTVASTGSISQRISYGSDQSNITIQMQGRNSNGLSVVHVDDTIGDTTISVYKL